MIENEIKIFEDEDNDEQNSKNTSTIRSIKKLTLVAQKQENINFIQQIDMALITKMMTGIKKFILH